VTGNRELEGEKNRGCARLAPVGRKGGVDMNVGLIMAQLFQVVSIGIFIVAFCFSVGWPDIKQRVLLCMFFGLSSCALLFSFVNTLLMYSGILPHDSIVGQAVRACVYLMFLVANGSLLAFVIVGRVGSDEDKMETSGPAQEGRE
jgi:hypothetical protein